MLRKVISLEGPVLAEEYTWHDARTPSNLVRMI